MPYYSILRLYHKDNGKENGNYYYVIIGYIYIYVLDSGCQLDIIEPYA